MVRPLGRPLARREGHHRRGPSPWQRAAGQLRGQRIPPKMSRDVELCLPVAPGRYLLFPALLRPERGPDGATSPW
jgi:hypothetical protein